MALELDALWPLIVGLYGVLMNTIGKYDLAIKYGHIICDKVHHWDLSPTFSIILFREFPNPTEPMWH